MKERGVTRSSVPVRDGEAQCPFCKRTARIERGWDGLHVSRECEHYDHTWQTVSLFADFVTEDDQQ